VSDYTKPLELISLRTFNKNIIDKIFSDCDTSLSILRHDELQKQALRTVGALTIRADGLGTWDAWTVRDTGELQAFNQPVNQSDNQTPNQLTDHSVSRPDFQTPHALANRSGISASLMTKLVGGKKGIL